MATPPKNPSDGTQPPAPRKPATPRKTTARKAPATPSAKTPARKPAAPRAAATKATTAPKKPAAKRSTSKTATAGNGRKWGIAAVVGGVGAAVTAGLLALRGSTPAATPFTPHEGKKAHQADGTDSSASFEAGIADEGTIPA